MSELRTMIDYHNARVYLLEGHRTLEPVAFGGTLNLKEYAGQTFDALRCEMGEGITGTAALRGQTLNIGDAQDCEFAEDVEGTDDIEESIVAVPMRFERSTIGVIVLSKLGKNQFSTLSVRLLELLAAQAAVAFENARLLEAERQSAAVSKALLEIATRAASEPSTTGVAEHVADTVRMLVDATAVAVVSRHGGHGRVIASSGDDAVRTVALSVLHAGHPAGGEVGVVRLADLPALSVEAAGVASHAIAAPLHSGLLVVLCDEPSDPAVRTILAVAGQATLALRNAELLAGTDTAVR